MLSVDVNEECLSCYAIEKPLPLWPFQCHHWPDITVLIKKTEEQTLAGKKQRLDVGENNSPPEYHEKGTIFDE
jgi:hypothetical protein